MSSRACTVLFFYYDGSRYARIFEMNSADLFRMVRTSSGSEESARYSSLNETADRLEESIQAGQDVVLPPSRHGSEESYLVRVLFDQGLAVMVASDGRRLGVTDVVVEKWSTSRGRPLIGEGGCTYRARDGRVYFHTFDWIA